MTICLPPQRDARFKAFFSATPLHQWRIGVKRWYQVLGGIWSMTLSLLGARGMFSHIQEALRHVKGKMFTLI